jgi:hypothetical protein
MKTSPKETSEDARIKHPLQAHSWIGKDFSLDQTDSFFSVFRGIDSIAKAIFDGSYPKMYEKETYPYLGYFRDSIDRHEGQSLSIPQLEIFAREIALQTAQQFPGFVGGKIQTAVLSDGHVSEFHQPLSNDSPLQGYSLDEFDNVSSDSGNGLLRIAPGSIAFVTNGHDRNGTDQPLDNIFFFRSDFSHVRFTYSGSPRSMFDRSNTVVESSLVLLPGADPGSNFVRQIKADFPQLNIIDQTKQ